MTGAASCDLDHSTLPILLVGLTLALSASGIDMTRFAIVVGAFTVGIGFGLRDVVNNFVSGLIVLFEHPVKAGDPIQIGDVVGCARYIGIRATMIESTSGASAIIPNGKLISGKFTNWTLSRHIRQIFVPGIARADLSADEVTSLPLDVTKENEKVMDSQEPFSSIETWIPLNAN